MTADRVATLRLRPRVQDMRDGTFQPIVVVDDGSNGSARFGDGLPTLKEAGDRACEACEGALPGGEWQADGWYCAVA